MPDNRVPLVRRNGDATGSDDAAFAGVLATLVEALRGVEFGVLGGVASAAYGRPRWTKDIDVFCRADEAGHALDLLADVGFEVERTPRGSTRHGAMAFSSTSSSRSSRRSTSTPR